MAMHIAATIRILFFMQESSLIQFRPSVPLYTRTEKSQATDDLPLRDIEKQDEIRAELCYTVWENYHLYRSEPDHDQGTFRLPRQDMNKSENPDESSLFGMLSPEFTTILLP